MFSPRENVYNLRDSQGKLNIPKPPTDYMKRSFSYRARGPFYGTVYRNLSEL